MPEIIEFSNKHFYAPEGKGLYPLKQYSENRLEPLIAAYCESGFTDGRGSRIINEPEANLIATTVAELIKDERYKGKTFGVITLQGNQQANLIENLILKGIGEQEFQNRKMVCGNSASFQGDERDVIFLSLVTAHNHKRSALVKPEDERRFNVAVSRAKEQIWLFHSIQLDDLSNTDDLRYKILDHFKNYKSNQLILSTAIDRGLGTQPHPFDSWFEVDVYNDIVRKGLSVIPQYEVAKGKYIIDLVALFANGTKIAIECDGDRWHGPEQHQNDLMRQKVLERCGWRFFRVRGYEYYTNRVKALEPLWAMIAKVTADESADNQAESITPTRRTQPSDFAMIINTIPAVENGVNEATLSEVRVSSEHGESNANDGHILRYFNLYKGGIYVMSAAAILDADFVIPVNSNQRDGFLLQCYSSGHINKVPVSVLLSKRIGKQYMNGLNKNDELKFLKIIPSEQIVGIYFRQHGKRKFKAHLTESLSSRELLYLQGIKVIYGAFENIEYKIFPLSIANDVTRLIFQSFTANGKELANNNYNSEWSILNRKFTEEVNTNDSVGGKDAVTNGLSVVSTLFGPSVKLNDTVKLRYLANGTVLTVKLVDYFPQNMEQSNGIRIISKKAPLAISLFGKCIGESVHVGQSDTVVEILEIL